METNYSVEGSTIWQHKAEDLQIINRIPAGVWTLRAHQMRGFYLEKTDPFVIPTKLYGTVARDSERILSTFHKRPSSTGVLLAGDAGSGKTMLAKKVCVDGIYSDMPTIVVNSDFAGPGFNTFIQGIQQDAVILFDEFEKIYSTKGQEEILTLLDGVVKTKKLFIFTCNDKWRINEHMQNRPGRIFYFKEYAGLGEDFIREFLNDRLKEHLKQYIDGIVQFAETFKSFNFDILQAVCEEMNRYDESPRQALAMLNARPGFNRVEIRYQMRLETPNGKKLALTNSYSGTPMMLGDDDISVTFYKDNNSDKIAATYFDLIGLNRTTGKTKVNKSEVDPEEVYVSFEDADREGPTEDGGILFINEDGYKLTLYKVKVKEVNELKYLA